MTQSSETQWRVAESEGLDAVAFLGALSGVPLYRDEYPAESNEFSTRLEPDILESLADLTASASSSGFGLMWPNLTSVLSLGATDSIDDVIVATEQADELLSRRRAELTWDEADWGWFLNAAPRLTQVLVAMRDAQFGDFRRELIGTALHDRAIELESQLKPFDVVGLDRDLSGKDLEPGVEIVLSYFCRPHGVRITGQRFIQSPDYDLMTTVRVAAHELLHPPIDMSGRVAQSVLAVLAADELFTRIVRDHDPSWGYTSLDGLLDEDTCQAIDQLVIEQLSVARNPADRWNDADGGMHVLAAGLYGMLREDGWVKRGGGSIEQWLSEAVTSNRLNAATLHAVAARVLERPVGQLWPVGRSTVIAA